MASSFTFQLTLSYHPLNLSQFLSRIPSTGRRKTRRSAKSPLKRLVSGDLSYSGLVRGFSGSVRGNSELVRGCSGCPSPFEVVRSCPELSGLARSYSRSVRGVRSCSGHVRGRPKLSGTVRSDSRLSSCSPRSLETKAKSSS